MSWSYTRQVKGELAGTRIGSLPCCWAELWGLSSRIHDPYDVNSPWVCSGAAFVIRRAYRLMKQLELNPQVRIERRVRRVEFSLWGGDVPAPDIEQSLSDCPAAIVRGAFLVHGYVSEVDRPVHWEIQAPNVDVKEVLMSAMDTLGVACRQSIRRDQWVLYVKDREQAAYLLGLMGAHQSVLAMESQSVVRQMKNQVNRLVNSETANMKRIVDSAVRDAQAITHLAQAGRLDQLTVELRQLADIRLKHPDWSFEEVGRYFRPPLSKSQVNHRLRRLRRWMQNELENR